MWINLPQYSGRTLPSWWELGFLSIGFFDFLFLKFAYLLISDVMYRSLEPIRVQPSGQNEVLR